MGYEGPQFYPRASFKHSEVFASWAKLFCADVHDLVKLKDLEETGIYFWLNHPIRFVRLVGLVVGSDERERFWQATLDDGSGRSVDLILQLPMVPVRGVHVGDLVKVKGTLSEFRQVRQVEVRRWTLLRDPNDEYRAWMETVEFKNTVLSQPWHLPSSLLDRSETPHKESRGVAANQHAQQKEAVKAGHGAECSLLQPTQYTPRNLARVLLEYVEKEHLHSFDLSHVRAQAALEKAATLVGNAHPTIQSQAASRRAFLAFEMALGRLVEDGSIACCRGQYHTVGIWNIGSLIDTAIFHAKRGNRTRKLYAREIWLELRKRPGWSAICKAVVNDVVHKVLDGQRGWTQGGPGVWNWN